MRVYLYDGKTLSLSLSTERGACTIVERQLRVTRTNSWEFKKASEITIQIQIAESCPEAAEIARTQRHADFPQKKTKPC